MTFMWLKGICVFLPQCVSLNNKVQPKPKSYLTKIKVLTFYFMYNTKKS